MSESAVMPVFRVLRLVRDARSTRNAQRELLYALAMRCQPAKKFICWPSYAQLAKDTLLDETTLKRAAKRLEDADLIKRVVRPNRSNCFYLNVALLQVQAAAVKEAEEAAKLVAEEDDESPFGDPVIDDARARDVANQDSHGDDEVWNRGGAR
jgi:DNA-binding MarR family transcriptional regulator